MNQNLRFRDEEAAEGLAASVQALHEQQVRHGVSLHHHSNACILQKKMESKLDQILFLLKQQAAVSGQVPAHP